MEPIECEHAKLVKALVKNPKVIQEELQVRDCNLIHAILGVSGEVGELTDAIKKAVIYRRVIDFENVVEELGDIEFYLQQLRSELGIERQETLKANVEKLKKRYGDSYSDEAAKTRADKV